MVIHPVIVIGAGPAGIATAVEVINRGYKAEDIVILEKSGEIAHMIAAKYPDEKPVLANYKERMAECIGDLCITDMSKPEFIDYLKQVVAKKKLAINFHQSVEKIVKLKNGQWRVDCGEDSWITNVVFVAIGTMSAARTLGVHIDTQIAHLVQDDIQSIKKEQDYVLVVGGGDSASEYAQILCQRGHKVWLSYRKDTFARMLPQNVEKLTALIDEKKVNFLPNSTITKITAKEDHCSVQFKTLPAINVHAVVTALGSDRPKAYLDKIGISVEKENGDDFQENEQGGIFLVGDLASGKKGGSINFAFNSGTKAVSKACSLYLDCDA
ncbi:MAG: hypothetical protein CME71_09165 [Halobacteriovorax sp.]|nr:hypothetical protein [Halobacteriovorax sp.]